MTEGLTQKSLRSLKVSSRWGKQIENDQDCVVKDETFSAAASRYVDKDRFPSWMLHMCNDADHQEKLECFLSLSLLSVGIRSAQSHAVYRWLWTWLHSDVSVQCHYTFVAKQRCETSTLRRSVLTNKYIKEQHDISSCHFIHPPGSQANTCCMQFVDLRDLARVRIKVQRRS